MNGFRIAVLALLGLAQQGYATESSQPQVVHGSASFVQHGANWSINTYQNKTIVNWHSFGVPEGSTTSFHQPKPSSAVLNRVSGPMGSGIYGTLESNGRVFLINPNGIVVGKQGVIHTRGFVGSTLDVKDSSFKQGGALTFAGNSDAAVVNLGRINASGKDVILMAAQVANQGAIEAESGKAALVAGREVTLTKDNQIFIRPSDRGVGGTGILNTGDIRAMQAELHAQGSLYALAINNEGDIHATSAVLEGGRVLLRAEGGVLRNSGTLSAQTVTREGKTHGGDVQILAETVILEGDAEVDASGDLGGGNVNIGGSYQGKGPLPNAQQVWVGDQVDIKANALEVGNGGTIVLWSDRAQWFYGKAEAKGGPDGGDGGFLEVSGKAYLEFRGLADLTAPQGSLGTLLLDPTSGEIKDGAGDGAGDGANTFAGDPSGHPGQLLADDNGPSTIYESELEAMLSTSNVIIQMTQDLTIQNLSDNLLALNLSTGSLSLVADADGNGSGVFSFVDPNDVIRTEGCTVDISGASIATLGGIDTTGASGTKTGGHISITSTGSAAPIGLGNRLVSLGRVTLDCAAGVTQAAGTLISADSLRLMGTAPFNLNTSVNGLDTYGKVVGDLTITNNKTLSIKGISISVSGNVTLTTLSGTIESVQALTSGGLVTFNAAAGCNGLGLVSGSGLLLLGAGNFNLNSAIDTVATGDLGPALVNVSNAGTLTVGSLGGYSGITASGGLSLTTTAGQGIVLNAPIHAGLGTVNLSWTGALTSNAGGVIDATGLNLMGEVGTTLQLDLDGVSAIGTLGSGLTGSGTIQLDRTGSLAFTGFNANGNTVVVNSRGATGGSVTAQSLVLRGAGTFGLNTAIDTLAADVNGSLWIDNAGALEIGAVAGADGVTTHGNDLTLSTGGALTIGAAMDAGQGTVSLSVSADGATQTTGGTITSGALQISGAGDFIFNQAGNRTPLLTATTSGGDIVIRSEGNIVVGTVNGSSGITATNAALLSLSAPNGYVQLSTPVLANGSGLGTLITSGDVRPAGSLQNFVLPGSGTIELNGQQALPPPSTYVPPPSLPTPDDNSNGPDAPGKKPDGDDGPTGGGGLVPPPTVTIPMLVSESDWELKLPKEVVVAELTLDLIIQEGFVDQYLPVTKDEIARSKEYIFMANRALVSAGRVYHVLPEEDLLRGPMAKLMRALKHGRQKVSASAYQLEYFLKRLYIEKMRDRVNQDAFRGALEELSLANENLALQAPVLTEYAKVMDGEPGALTNAERFEQVHALAEKAFAKARAEQDLAHKRQDRVFWDVLLFSWQDD